MNSLVLSRARWKWSGMILATVALLLMAGVGAAMAQANPRLPNGVPDLLHPQTEGQWQSYQLGNIEGNPDFPILVFVNRGEEQPAAVMIAVNAQNGKDSWSLTSDPAIVVALFSDPQTITRLYYDAGFVRDGQASGEFAEVQNPAPERLAELMSAVVHNQAPDQGEAGRQARNATPEAATEGAKDADSAASE